MEWEGSLVLSTRLFKLPEPLDRDTAILDEVTSNGRRSLLGVPMTARSSIGFQPILNWTSPLEEKPA